MIPLYIRTLLFRFLLPLFLCTVSESNILYAQCDFSDDYSTNSGWTQVGTDVEVSGGAVRFINGAVSGQQRRVYKSIGDTLNSDDCWKASIDLYPESFGTLNGFDMTATYFLCITAGNQEPTNDCPDVPCTGLPAGTQDGFIASLASKFPPDGDVFFKIVIRDGTNEYVSVDKIDLTTAGSTYVPDTFYVEFEKTKTDIILSVFLDSLHTTHLTGSPISMTGIPTTVNGLHTVQHLVPARGQNTREFNGTLDNLCIEINHNCGIQYKDTSLTICKGEQITLLDSTFTINRWVNAEDTSVTLSTNQSYTVSPSQPIDFLAIGDSNVTTFHIEVDSFEFNLLPGNSSLCSGDSLALFPDFYGDSLIWQDGSTDSVFMVNDEGLYWIEITNGSCIIRDSVYIDTTTCFSNCDFSDDYSTNSGWTQVGTDVEVSGGGVQYINGSANGEQRRVYKPLGDTLNSEDCWKAKIDFYAESFGTLNGEDMTSVYFLCLTSGTNEPTNDCPDIPCTGQPVGTQDGYLVVLGTANPPNGEVYFRLKLKDGTAEYTSTDKINITTASTPYVPDTFYVELEKTLSDLILRVYSDSNRTTQLAGSPISMTNIPATINGVKYLQHASSARGRIEREFNGTLDNFCMEIDANCGIQYKDVYLSLCEGEQITLSDTAFTINKWTSENDTSITLSTNQTYVVSPSVSTTFLAVGDNIITNFHIQVDAFDFTLIPGNSTLCFGDTLNVYPDQYGETLLWQDGSMDSAIQVFDEGLYWLEITDGACVRRDSIFIDTIDCFSNCDISDNYSSNSGWTQVGTNVEISSGGVQYLNGSVDGVQRRVYKPLGDTLNNEDCWKAQIDVYAESFGTLNGHEMVAISFLALTEDIQEPFNDCPDIPCTGQPVGNQDGFIAVISALNPPDGDVYFRLKMKDGTTEYTSTDKINITTASTPYVPDTFYVEMEKTLTDLILRVYVDPARTIHLAGSPISISNIPNTINNIKYIQHANQARGREERKFNGTLDNLCIEINHSCDPIDTLDLDSSEVNLSICEGEQITLFDSTYSITKWVNKADTTTVISTNPFLIVAPSENTTYIAYGDSNVTVFNITIESFGFALLPGDTSICVGDEVILFPDAFGDTQTWQNGSTDSTLTANSEGMYWLQIVKNQCFYSDTLYIDTLACEFYLELPNIFTPNADGTNDLMTPIKSKGIISMQTFIFNRWGRKVFETNDIDIKWDAANHKPGTYYWLVEYTEQTGKTGIQKGFILLIR